MSLLADLQDYAFNATFLLLNDLEDVVRQYLKDVKAKVLHMKKVSAIQNESMLAPIVIYLFKLSRLPLVILYYVYIMPFLFISRKVLIYFTLAVKIICRRSPPARHIVEHIIALYYICRSVVAKVLTSKLTELIAFCITTIFEIIVAVLWPSDPTSPQKGLSMALSVEELAELLAYEEVDPDGEESTGPYPPQYHRLRGMHHYIPANPFKATIRIHRSVPMAHLQSAARGRAGTDLVPADQAGSCLVDYQGVDSPASFPPTPFSRANVMNKSLDRVASVMFAARDRLRLEAQSVSRDEYTRMMAVEAQTSGQFAVFDPRLSSPGVALSCGNHCAIKVGKGLCCCCVSMVPVRPNAYVYFEFSVMVSSAKTPTLGIGLSPQDCPTNVMVGSWPKSQGLYNDGQMLIGSHWYQCLNNKRIEAGSTVGMLVYIPAATTTLGSGFAGIAMHQAEAPSEGFAPQHSAIWETNEEHQLDTSGLDSSIGGNGGARNNNSNNNQEGNQSFLSSILQTFSRSGDSLDPDASVGMVLSGNDSSSSSQSQGNSAQSSPEKSRSKAGGQVLSLDTVGGEGNGDHGADQQDPAPGTYGSAIDRAGTTPRSRREALFHFTVNGEAIEFPAEVAQGLQEIVSTHTPLFPTVSLFSEETRVWCRFCEADVVYRSRAIIGAPPGVRVYSLDGSLILEEKD